MFKVFQKISSFYTIADRRWLGYSYGLETTTDGTDESIMYWHALPNNLQHPKVLMYQHFGFYVMNDL